MLYLRLVLRRLKLILCWCVMWIIISLIFFWIGFSIVLFSCVLLNWWKWARAASFFVSIIFLVRFCVMSYCVVVGFINYVNVVMVLCKFFVIWIMLERLVLLCCMKKIFVLFVIVCVFFLLVNFIFVCLVKVVLICVICWKMIFSNRCWKCVF